MSTRFYIRSTIVFHALNEEGQQEAAEHRQKYNALIEERERTPRALIAAYFKIPWSQLTEQEYSAGYYITDTKSGHIWRVPCKEIATDVTFSDGSTGRMMLGQGDTVYVVHEIDENRQPVTTHMIDEGNILYAIVNNGKFVAEMDPPPPQFFIGTPF